MVKLLLLLAVLIIAIPFFRRTQRKPEPDPLPPKPKKPTAGPSDAGDDDEDGAPPAAPDFGTLMRTVVVLEDNDWAACTFDGAKEEWSRFTSDPVRGFCTIPAGRHRAVTRVGDRDAALDFVLRPGEIFVRRLDRAEAAWVPLEDTALAEVLRAAEGGEGGALSDALVRYRSTMGVARVMKGSMASPAKVYDDTRRDLADVLAAAQKGDSFEGLEARAAKLGDALVGVPLLAPQLDALVAMVKDAAAPGVDHRDNVLALGTVVLPGTRFD